MFVEGLPFRSPFRLHLIMLPGITLLCITRDQAGKLMRMLASVKGVVDDIVVFDTGSKDLSPGVAKLHGARVFQVEWPDSFSEALNLAMRAVKTEWTLRLDTDEWLVDGAGQVIRSAAKDEKAFAYRLVRRDLSSDEVYSEANHLRMWRTDASLSFAGHIHEHFEPDSFRQAANGRDVLDLPAAFWHDGFMGDASREKHVRNLKLLLKELHERPGQLYYEIELATTLLQLGEREGEERINSIVDGLLEKPIAFKELPLSANALGAAMSLVRQRDFESLRTNRVVEAAWQHFSDSPPMLWSIAHFEVRRGNLPAARDALLRLEALAEAGTYRREWTFDGLILRNGLWDFLAQIASALGDENLASKYRGRLTLA